MNVLRTAGLERSAAGATSQGAHAFSDVIHPRDRDDLSNSELAEQLRQHARKPTGAKLVSSICRRSAGLGRYQSVEAACRDARLDRRGEVSELG